MSKRKRKRTKKPRPKTIDLTFGDPDHDCPICRGEAKLVEVTVRGDAPLWPRLPAEPFTEQIYAGASTVGDLLMQLQIRHPALLNEPALGAVVDGELRPLGYLLCPGDSITVTRPGPIDHLRDLP